MATSEVILNLVTDASKSRKELDAFISGAIKDLEGFEKEAGKKINKAIDKPIAEATRKAEKSFEDLNKKSKKELEDVGKNVNNVKDEVDELAKKSNGNFFTKLSKNSAFKGVSDSVENATGGIVKLDKVSAKLGKTLGVAGTAGSASLATITATTALVVAGLAVLVTAIGFVAFKFSEFILKGTAQGKKFSEDLKEDSQRIKDAFSQSFNALREDLAPIAFFIQQAFGKAFDFIADVIVGTLDKGGDRFEKFGIIVATIAETIAESFGLVFNSVSRDINLLGLRLEVLLKTLDNYRIALNLAGQGKFDLSKQVAFGDDLTIKGIKQEIDLLKESNGVLDLRNDLINLVDENYTKYTNLAKEFDGQFGKKEVENQKEIAESAKKGFEIVNGVIETTGNNLAELQRQLKELKEQLAQANPDDNEYLKNANKEIVVVESAIDELKKKYAELRFEAQKNAGLVGVPIPDSPNLNNSGVRQIAKDLEQEEAERIAEIERRKRLVSVSDGIRNDISTLRVRTGIADGINADDIIASETSDEIAERMKSIKDAFLDGKLGVNEFLDAFSQAEKDSKQANFTRSMQAVQGSLNSAEFAFGQFAGTFKEGSKENQVAMKAQILAQNALAISNQIVAVSELFKNAVFEGSKFPFPANIPVILTLVGIAFQVVNTFKQLFGEVQQFKEGGFTRKGNPNEVAGVVHENEFVANEKITNENRALFEGLHNNNDRKLREGIEKLMKRKKISFSDNLSVINTFDMSKTNEKLDELNKRIEVGNRYTKRMLRKQDDKITNFTVELKQSKRRG